MIDMGTRSSGWAGRGRFVTGSVLALVMLSVAAVRAADEAKGSGMHPHPLWPSEPVPGWPGVGADEEFTVEKIQEKIPDRKVSDPRPPIYGQPEFLAYPGAVHHLRHFMQRYVPPYPLNNHNTLVKNFVMHEMAQTKAQCIDFAEPVYYNPMYRPRMRTTQKRPPVKVYPWKPDSAAIKLDIGKLPRSVYVLRPIIAAPSVTTVVNDRKFVFLRLSINDLPDQPREMNEYILKACALDNFYSVTEFFFHSRGDGRAFKAEMELLPESELDVLLYNIDLHDRFGEHARRAGKKQAVLGYMLPGDPKERNAIWAKNRAEDKRGHEHALRSNPAKTTEQQKVFDDQVWGSLMPPLNAHHGGGWYTKHLDMSKHRICRAPNSWRRYLEAYKGKGLLLDCRDGKLYKNMRQEYGTTPPPYELRNILVYRKKTVEQEVDGQTKKVTELELVGPLSECEYTVGAGYWTHTPIKHKGKELGKIHEFAYQGGLYRDGEPVDKLCTSAFPLPRYFDEQLRNPLLREISIKPGLYYDSNVVNRMNRADGVTGTNHGKYFSYLSRWAKFGERQDVRDAAMKFVRLCHDIPAMQVTRGWEYVAGFEGLDRGLLRTPGHAMGSSGSKIAETLTFYDTIFPFLATDQEFASAVGRYVPWVKTPQDVVELVDTYLVQDYANNVMKYRIYTDHEQAQWMMTAILVQNDSSISDPWMEFLFKRGWEYPQALSGFGDNLATGTGRDGGTTIGSFMYALGGATKTMEMMEKYMKYGGNPKYDLTDPRQYPAVRMKPYLLLEGNAAGRVNPGIGDVGGPAEYYGRLAGGLYRGVVEAGWRWHKDPRFAWELVNLGRQHQTDAEWAKIEAAAKNCPRDPYLMNKSRVLSNWGGYLRHNADTDDWRFPRELSIRVGTGWGHAHSDTLDLRLFAFGMTMSGDFNQRPAYGWPAHHRTECHNVVEVDRTDWRSHAWIRNLYDAPGSPYLAAESVAPYGLEHVKLFRRQCAYVQVQDGKPGDGVKDPMVAMPSQYALDVFRVSGGKEHTYSFHGCIDDGFEANVANKRKPTREEDSPDGYLNQFRWWATGDVKAAGIGGYPAPAHEYWVANCAGQDLVATWQLSRKAEKYMLRGSVNTEPRKYTRLTLLDQKDSKILHGHARAAGGNGQYGRCLYTQKSSKDQMDTVFVALIEPYAGEPGIVSHRRLRVRKNDRDAREAVAVEVTTRNGRRDLLFADGRPGRERTVFLRRGLLGLGSRTVCVSGEYAYVSCEENGLRQATLTGGTLLETPDVRIEVETPRYEAIVTQVDYLGRRVTLKGKLPARLAGHFFEVGNDLHKTSYEVEAIKGNTLTLRKGIEIMRTRVRTADPQTGKVMGSIAMFRHRGRDAGLVASNDALTKFWRVAYSGGNRHAGHEFTLTHLDPEAKGPAFKAGDFPTGEGLRVWEFGIGDTFRLQTGVSIRRTEAGVYEIYATAPFRLGLGGRKLSWSADQKAWRALPVTNGAVSLTEAQLGATGRLFLRAN